MKKYMVMVLLMMSAIFAMEREDIPAEVSGESTEAEFKQFSELPFEIQIKIALSTISVADTVDEAFENIQKMTMLNKAFSEWSQADSFKKAVSQAMYQRFAPRLNVSQMSTLVDRLKKMGYPIFSKELLSTMYEQKQEQEVLPVDESFFDDSLSNLKHAETMEERKKPADQFIFAYQLTPGLMNEPRMLAETNESQGKEEEDEDLVPAMPLHWMVQVATPAMLAYILPKLPNLDVNITDENGYTALEIAALEEQDGAKVQVLLAAGANPLLPVAEGDGKTILQQAQDANVSSEIINALAKAAKSMKEEVEPPMKKQKRE